MPLKLKSWDRDRLRLFGVALIAAAIVHILATLAAPYVNTSNAYARLSGRIPVNQFVVLPVLTPATQQLPFQLPDFRYAICRFDARRGPIQVRASLAEPGWILSITSSTGDNVYALQSQVTTRNDISLILVPPGERFNGLVGDSPTPNTVHVSLPTSAGMIVVRAPVPGNAFKARSEQALASNRCSVQQL